MKNNPYNFKIMTETKLNLANDLVDRISSLKAEREKHKKAFDIVCSRQKAKQPKRRLLFFQFWRFTFTFTFVNLEDLKKVLEARIIEIDSELEDTKKFFSQL